MNPKDLRCYAISGQLRIYEDYVLAGYEAVVTTADEHHVMLLTHNLTKTYELRLTWEEFTKNFTLRADTTAEKQALQLRNTLRTIATKFEKHLPIVIERYLDQAPNLNDVTVKASKKPAPIGPVVRADYYRHTCLELGRCDETVTYIALGNGTLDVEKKGAESFDEEFSHVMPDYPVEKAAQLYVQFALHLGATKGALDALGRFVSISKKDYDMATAKPVTEGVKKPAPAVKNSPPAAKKATAPAAKKAPTVKALAPAKAEKPAKPAAKPAEKKPASPRKGSAASRFQELILEGKLTDEEIFAIVKKEFSLDDSKRSYVAWYRNYLIKKGANPPPAKEAKKAA